ncbi:MAG: ABC transporter substrate-binding protein [Chloroflexota bacterium]|mgnify:CR=1 FL=1
MMHRVLWLILSGLLVFGACTPAATPTATPKPTPTQVKAQYPMTVTDMMGRSVTVAQRPSRVVTISPTATEMLYRVGGTAVGRDTSSKFPPEAQPLPTVGGAYTPSVEAIVALQPDMIIIEALSQGRLVASLEKVGKPVLAVRASSLDDVVQSLALVGKVIDRQVPATQAGVEVRARVNAAAGTVAAPRKVLIFISDAERNIYAAKPESYVGSIAALLKLTNGAAGLPDSGPYPGFTLFSAEQAIRSQPDIIFTISPAPEPAPRLSAVLSQVPGYGDVAAVKEGRVKELNPDLFLQAPGPRLADAVEEMGRLVGLMAK